MTALNASCNIGRLIIHMQNVCFDFELTMCDRYKDVLCVRLHLCMRVRVHLVGFQVKICCSSCHYISHMNRTADSTLSIRTVWVTLADILCALKEIKEWEMENECERNYRRRRMWERTINYVCCVREARISSVRNWMIDVFLVARDITQFRVEISKVQVHQF